MSRIDRDTTGGAAYLDLQRLARDSKRPTDELIQLYVLEGFLARLAASPLADRFVLKGGVLLAAFGDRRPTRDVDLAAVDVSNDVDDVLDLVRQIAAMPLDDGLMFDATTATAEMIRGEDEYSGVRVSMDVELATGRPRLKVDVNVGDPIWPGPETVAVPRLLGGKAIELSGYPLGMVHAEKLVTAIQRGVANTRWRDFGDVWTLSRRHPTEGTDLQQAITEVARHRKAQLAPLAEVLVGYGAIAQPRWATWRRRQRPTDLPERFEDLLREVGAFADPAIAKKVGGLTWDPAEARWRQ